MTISEEIIYLVKMMLMNCQSKVDIAKISLRTFQQLRKVGTHVPIKKYAI